MVIGIGEQHVATRQLDDHRARPVLDQRIGNRRRHLDRADGRRQRGGSGGLPMRTGIAADRQGGATPPRPGAARGDRQSRRRQPPLFQMRQFERMQYRRSRRQVGRAHHPPRRRARGQCGGRNADQVQRHRHRLPPPVRDPPLPRLAVNLDPPARHDRQCRPPGRDRAPLAFGIGARQRRLRHGLGLRPGQRGGQFDRLFAMASTRPRRALQPRLIIARRVIMAQRDEPWRPVRRCDRPIAPRPLALAHASIGNGHRFPAA